MSNTESALSDLELALEAFSKRTSIEGIVDNVTYGAGEQVSQIRLKPSGNVNEKFSRYVVAAIDMHIPAVEIACGDKLTLGRYGKFQEVDGKILYFEIDKVFNQVTDKAYQKKA